MPKVSVCIPTYNRAEILPYAVHSVLKQSYGDFELIICDDASPDNTPDVVKQWQDPRIRYIRHPVNIKRSRNMRSGFEAAKGEYFIKFDDDDALTPQFLEKTVMVLESNPEVDFVCTDHWIINAKNEQDEAATQALPERARLVFTLSREGGLSYSEIAETLGVTVKAVEAAMTRALRALRKDLEPFLR